MTRSDSFLFLFVCFSISIISCDSNRIYDTYKPVPNKWHQDSIIRFKVKPPDSLKTYNLFINLRNTNAYKYNNLFLITELIYPNGKTTTDTLEYKMADPSGKFLGSGYTNIKENKLWYKGHDKKFIFNESGTYTIHIQHAMRERNKINGIVELEGITDIGFRIENTYQN